LSIQDDVDLLGIWAEHANLQIVANPVRTQNPEWIGMFSGEKGV
jgi:hypothetical protein